MFEVGQKIKIITGEPMGIEGLEGRVFTVINTLIQEVEGETAVLDYLGLDVLYTWIEAGYAEIVK